MVQVTAVYVGGPNDGETEEIEAGPGPGDAPGMVRVFGVEIWPVGGESLGPSGRYEPDTSGGGHTVPFIWQPYTPEEQGNRLNDPEVPFRVTRLTGLPRLINRAFLGTPISSWIVRRTVRQRKDPVQGAGRPDPPKGEAGEVSDP